MTHDVAELIASQPLPELEGGKESKGDLVVVGGAASCPGSAILAGRSALRCAAGRVQLVVHPSLTAAVGAALPEVLVLGWDPRSRGVPLQVRDRLAGAAAVVVGPGLDDEAVDAALAVAEHLKDAALVLDARSIPALADPAVTGVTTRLAAPNPQEACRLLGQDVDGEPDLCSLVAGVAKLLDGPGAVRGAWTVVDDGEGGQWVQGSPTPGLGTPGSGDVLVGALGGLLSRGATPLAALGWAISAHARAGAILAEAHEAGFLASEVCDALPSALRQLQAPPTT